MAFALGFGFIRPIHEGELMSIILGLMFSFLFSFSAQQALGIEIVSSTKIVVLEGAADSSIQQIAELVRKGTLPNSDARGGWSLEIPRTTTNKVRMTFRVSDKSEIVKSLDNDIQLSGEIAEALYTSIGYATIGESFGERRVNSVRTSDYKIICNYGEYNQPMNNHCWLR
jgi:hypothetical protein